MSSSQPAASIPSGGSAPSSSQPLASASASTTANGVGTAVTPASGTSGARNDASPKQASSKTSSSGAYRDEYDEEDADCDDDDDEVDPRYAIDSYQSSSKSSAPGGISSSNAQPSNKHVVFDAASHAAENRAGSSQGGQARGSHLPAWGSAALARGQNQTQEQQQQGIPSSSSRSTLPDHFSYATSHGVQLSSLCFAAWAFPPFSSVLVLVWETENDLARFHAYQAGICGVALVVLLYFLRSWLGAYTLSIIVGMGGLGWFWVCGSAASNNAPTLERVPYIAYAGPLAEQWLGDE